MARKYPRRIIEGEELEDVQRLRKIWEERRIPLNLNQTRLAKEMGIGAQAVISQYMHAKIPLNLAVVVKFAKVLRCRVRDISPRYAKWVDVEPMDLDIYHAPKMGHLGGYPTNDTIDWFAFSDSFIETHGPGPHKAFLVRDGSSPDVEANTVVVACESFSEPMTSGLYLMVSNRAIVARKIDFEGSTATIYGPKKITVAVETIGLMQVLAKVTHVLKGL